MTATLDPDRVTRAAEALANDEARIRPGEEPGTFVVGSFTGDTSYLVDLERRTCTCPDNRHHGGVCKHVAAVLLSEGEG